MKYIFSTLILFVSGLQIVAQEHPDPKEKLKSLDFLLGSWIVESDVRLSGSGPWEKTTAVAQIKKTLDSTLIEEEFAGTRQGKGFLAKALFAHNSLTNKFQMIFIDAPHGVLMDYEGVKRQDSLIFDKSFINAIGIPVKVRVVYKIVSNDTFSIENMRMPQGTAAWDVTSRRSYRRKL